MTESAHPDAPRGRPPAADTPPPGDPAPSEDPAPPDPATFLSGESGTVAGKKLTVTRTAADWAQNAAALAALTGPRLDRLAATQPPRRVLALSIYRPGSLLPRALPRLRSDRHTVAHAFGATGPAEPALAAETALDDLAGGGKFENLNRLLAAAPPLDGFDWLVVSDDDVELAAALPRPRARALRAARPRPRPARPDDAQPCRVARHPPPPAVARSPHRLRRDRPGDALLRAAPPPS